MPELRRDPVLGRWVIISVERDKRPGDYVNISSKRKGGFCPFCAGNEYTTPPEISAIRRDGSGPNEPGWSLRIMPNKFPALASEGSLNKMGQGLYDMMNGVGAHEVVVETPDHDKTMADLTLEEFEDAMWAYYQRLTSLKHDNHNQYVLIFKNEGEVAGATLDHSHSQIIALPIVPRTVMEEIKGAKYHYDHRDRCLFCDIIYQERSDKRRIVYENDDYIAIAPFAPRSPFETWILPKAHESAFGPRRDSFRGLTEIFSTVLKMLNELFGSVPYNFMIHTSPFKEEQNEYYHWHIEMKPTLTKMAGFEWGSGFYINPTPPEDAARFMRETLS